MTLLTTAPWQSAERAESETVAPLRLRDVRLSWPDGQDDDGEQDGGATVHESSSDGSGAISVDKSTI